MLIGKLNTDDTTATALAPDKNRAQQHYIPERVHLEGTTGRDHSVLLARIAAYLDGNGGSVGQAKVKAVVYDAARKLLGISDELLIDAGAAPAWHTFRFPAPPVLAPDEMDANVLFALHVGGDSGVLRIYPAASGTVPGKLNTDTYADGPVDPYPALTTVAPAAMYGDVFCQFRPPIVGTDFAYARLPFHDAQHLFGSGGVARAAAHRVSVAWHGTRLDPERGSFAVIKAGGIFDDDLIGQRVRISHEFNGVVKVAYAFVHNVADLDPRDEMSLTRRVWMALELPAVDRRDMVIERMA